MTAKVPLDQLPPELRRKLEPKTRIVPERIIAMGKVLQTLEGMSRRDALWVLRKAINELGGK